MMTRDYDAIVISAGPAGSMAARTLAERGRNVLLLEKGSFPGRKKACGGVLAYKDFTEFDISESVIETRMKRAIAVWFRRVTSSSVVSVSRTVFDEHLAMAARESGASLLTCCRATNVTRRKNFQVEVEIYSENAKKVFTAPLVIFSDGVNSLAYRTMRTGFRKRGDNLAFGLVYEFESFGNQLTDFYIFFNLHPLTHWGYAWIFPNRHILNVGVFLLESEFRRNPHKKNLLEHYIFTADTEFAHMLRGKKILKKTGAHIPLEVATQLCDDSVLTTGDAAGLVFPFTGGGIHTALYSGQLAGLTADGALTKKDFSRQVLYAYEEKIKNSALSYDM
jgi:geranylgeranyl reductase family protein